MNLFIEDKAWLNPSAFNQLLEDRLILAQRNDPSSDSLRLEPGLGEWDFEDALFLLRCGRT
jgi:hypothetical protein